MTPCAAPENDPEDWFISKDGRQYPDDDLVFNVASLVADARANFDDRPEDEIVQEAEDQAVQAALVRRRHAKDKCHVDCYLRTQCLGLALAPNAPLHGTWGGYYEEELKKIRDLRDERQRQRTAREE